MRVPDEEGSDRLEIFSIWNGPKADVNPDSLRILSTRGIARVKGWRKCHRLLSLILKASTRIVADESLIMLRRLINWTLDSKIAFVWISKYELEMDASCLMARYTRAVCR